MELLLTLFFLVMRDIFGVDIRAGDLLELWYGKVKEGGKEFVQILPVAGCTDSVKDTQDFNNNNRLPAWFTANYGQSESIYSDFYKQHANHKVVRAPIGKLWATPLHHPFQSTGNLVNIVGHDAGDSAISVESTFGQLGTDASKVYKNIEVELSPCRIHDCV